MHLTLEQEEKLGEILQLAGVYRHMLSDWEKGFVDDLTNQYEEKGSQTLVSSRMWVILGRVEAKCEG